MQAEVVRLRNRVRDLEDEVRDRDELAMMNSRREAVLVGEHVQIQAESVAEIRKMKWQIAQCDAKQKQLRKDEAAANEKAAATEMMMKQMTVLMENAKKDWDAKELQSTEAMKQMTEQNENWKMDWDAREIQWKEDWYARENRWKTMQNLEEVRSSPESEKEKAKQEYVCRRRHDEELNEARRKLEHMKETVADFKKKMRTLADHIKALETQAVELDERQEDMAAELEETKEFYEDQWNSSSVNRA